jgi:hypothetical protein
VRLSLSLSLSLSLLLDIICIILSWILHFIISGIYPPLQSSIGWWSQIPRHNILSATGKQGKQHLALVLFSSVLVFHQQAAAIFWSYIDTSQITKFGSCYVKDTNFLWNCTMFYFSEFDVL